MSARRFESVTLHICAVCGMPVESTRLWHKLILTCGHCRSFVTDQSDPLINPIAILETAGAGTSSYLACLHMHLMRGQKKVKSTGQAFDRMTRVFLSGAPVPEWAARQNLPKGIYRPFTFEWASRLTHLVAGPLVGNKFTSDEKSDRNWLALIRHCSATIISLRMTILLGGGEEFAMLDQALATRLRTILEPGSKIRRAVLMLNAADAVAIDPADAESRAAEALHKKFAASLAVATNAGVSLFAVPNSTWGFGVKNSDGLRFPIGARPFNVLEPVRCAIGNSVSSSSASTQRSGRSPPDIAPDEYSFPRAAGYTFDLAISYASEDVVYVAQVAEFLRQAGVRVYFDRFEQSAMWGENLPSRLAEIYQDESLCVVVFVSQHYLKSYWTQHERRHIASRLIGPNSSSVLHARLDKAELPGQDSDVVYLDAQERPADNVAQVLLARLRHAASANGTQSPPPR